MHQESVNKQHSINKGINIREISAILNATMPCGNQHLDHETAYAFASDLMSDVLTLTTDSVLLITGLANVQSIRTAEMSDIKCIIYARGKKASPEMIELAEENDMVLMECRYSMFKISGLLYRAGVQPVY
jgi:predicted transcriptional regulator